MNDSGYSEGKYLNEKIWESILTEVENNDESQQQINYKGQELRQSNEENGNDWSYLSLIKESNQIIECKVYDFNYGGLLVKHEKFNGFIPLSHLKDTSLIATEKVDQNLLNEYLDKNIRVKVLEFEASRNRVVLSEKAANINEKEKIKLLKKIKLESVFVGKVTNITDFGLFIDLGGIEGLVHISEISWERVKNIRKKFKLEQEVKVKVVEISADGGKISLSIKNLSPNPWESLTENYPKGKNFIAKVINIAKYGVFVKLENGLEGLIHTSEMKMVPDHKLADIFEIGEQLLVELISVDVEKQRMSLRLVE